MYRTNGYSMAWILDRSTMVFAAGLEVRVARARVRPGAQDFFLTAMGVPGSLLDLVS